MNKSETPRTDAFLLKHGPNGIALIHWWRVIKEHARQLERELSAAKAALDVAMRERNDAMQAALNDMNARLRAEAALADAERKIERLKALLHSLHSLVWGECPSLLNEDSGGSGHLDADIRAEFKE